MSSIKKIDNNGIEILLHNLSHSDLVLECSSSQLVDSNGSPATIIARPKFSNFREISEKIWSHILVDKDQSKTTLHPLLSIANINPYSRPSQSFGTHSVPVGFQLDKVPPVVIENSLHALRFRMSDFTRLLTLENGNFDTSCLVKSVNFPLVAVLLPKWLRSIDSTSKGKKKVVVLVSGRGNPSNESAPIADNSTKYTAKLIELFLRATYPEIDEVRLLHSTTNLFRYDENILFVKRQLLPLVDSYRDQLFAEMGAKWRECMRVSLSFADGSSARISAINASLRYYRPSYMHFWQLKTFWREHKICEDDIELHSFEEVSTETAISLRPLQSEDPNLRRVADEMQAFRQYFYETTGDPTREHDLTSFWLRKSGKVVLAVLLVQKEGGPPKLYRGLNMEVSMPTGSLCAERNVIGSAFADDITLRRRDLKLIAVYSATLPRSRGNLTQSTVLSSGSSSSSISLEGSSTVPSTANSTPIHTPRSPSFAQKRAIMQVRLPPTTTTTTTTSVVAGQVVQSSMAFPKPRSLLQRSVSLGGAECYSSTISRSTTLNADPNPNPTLINPHESDGNPGNRKRVYSHMDAPESSGNRSKIRKSIAFAPLVPLDVLSPPSPNANLTSQHNPFSTLAAAVSASGSADEEADDVYCQPVSTTLLSGAAEVITIEIDENDMNPLKPCGACNEWLKKIAEDNPQLKVVTFTDANCHGIYVEQIQAD